MSSPVDHLIAHLAACRQELAAAYLAAPAASREARPPNQSWSVAQIIEHLAITDDLFAKFLAKQIAELGRGERETVDVAELLQRRRLQAVLDRGVKVDAQEWILPTNGWTASQAWERLEQRREHLLAVIRSAGDVPLSKGRFVHHVLGELNLYETIAFAGYHERRHAAQIRETVALLEQPPTP